MKKTKTGLFLIYATLSITFFLWILAKSSISEVTMFPLISINQITALLGTILFMWSMILATRLNFLENLFGGLDKIYRTHRKVSEIGFALIVLHPVMLALSSPRIGLKYFAPVHNKDTVNLGIYSFWVFVIAIILTLFIKKIKLPYHVWKQTHKFLNLAMILALLHIATVKSDTSIFAPLGIWMLITTGLGVASGIYMSFLYKLFGPKYKYEIVNIIGYDDVHDVYLKPLKAKLPHKLAQYAYVSFISDDLPKESHPYCITSLPEDALLRFSIKELGDYTEKLGTLKVGDNALIYGPYGMLSTEFENNQNDAVLIAGGIGIAPFLSMFKKAALDTKGRRTSLFYCTKYKNEASFENELEQIADTNHNLTYCNQCSREIYGHHLSMEQVNSCVSNPKQTNVFLCGPSHMMGSLKKDLIEHGFPKHNISLEDFEMI